MTGAVHGPESVDDGAIPEMPTLDDGYDQDLLVSLAYRSMYTYAGGRLYRGEADILLGFWRNYGRLTEGQHRALLARFPDPS